jgi:hypothetical protein
MTEIILGTGVGGSASNSTQPANFPLTTLTPDFILFDFETGLDPSSRTVTPPLYSLSLLRVLGILFFDANGNSVATIGTTIANNGTAPVITLPAGISAVKAILVFGR